MTDTKRRCMKQVQMYSFAVTEAILFLDTHPQDTAALAYYNKYAKLLREAIKLYEDKFGPITQTSQTPPTSWNWVLDPWPWEIDESCGQTYNGRW